MDAILAGGIRGWAIVRCQTISNTTNPIAMATKFKTKSPITRLVYEISQRCLRITRGFSGTSYPMMLVKF